MQLNIINSYSIGGFADYTAEQHVEFSNWKKTVGEIFEAYGFPRFESRRVERASDLTKKGGLDREIWALTHWKGGEIVNVNDNQENALCIPFDRTVPMAIFLANNPNLKLPFKRQDIDYSWRVETPGPGRFRSFVQADADVVDTRLSVLAIAECMKAGLKAVEKIGMKKIVVYLNHINVAKTLINTLELGEDGSAAALRIVDKLDKISPNDACEQLQQLVPNYDKSTLEALVELFAFKGTIEEFNQKYQNDPQISKEIIFFIEEVNSLVSALEASGINKSILKFCPGMVRGLDYYTGIVFETFLNVNTKFDKFSILSGGRYDNLVDTVSSNSESKTNMQGFGFSIGLTRLFDLCVRESLLSQPKRTLSEVMIGYRKEKILPGEALSHLEKISSQLADRVREKGFSADLYTRPEAVKKQLAYANDLGFPNVIMVMGEKNFVVKNMVSETQFEVETIESAVKVLKKNITIQKATNELSQYPQADNPSGKKMRAPKQF